MNGGTETLPGYIMVPQVAAAVRAWVEAGGGGVLIGDCALTHHARPRVTQDTTFLFLRAEELPTVIRGFDRIGAHVFRHRATGEEVRAVTPDAVRVPMDLAERVVATAIHVDGMAIATGSGLAAVLLFRRDAQARADVVALVKAGRVELGGFALPPDKLDAFAALALAAERETQMELDDPPPK
ncbi:hypothetical protein [Roseicella aerolata]|uniref:Uncharacterized protein n=1 Tax=Roseicella aerolata TaxID=2883479 RepID=A0A9X1LDU9_9PROT|nr:hypothetical protein [Roseicella aerolata]MCB4825352.1 hypothetical protein [Roseicella aerolata]